MKKPRRKNNRYIFWFLLKIRFLSLFFRFLFILFISFFIISETHAVSVDYDFSTGSEYTIEDSTTTEIRTGVWRLKYFLSHTWTITNGGTTLLDNPSDIFIDGDYAYVASNNSDAVEIIDISDSSSPTHVSSIVNGYSWALLDDPRALSKSWSYLFVASNRSDTIEVIDVSTPSSPNHAWSISDGGTTYLRKTRGLTIVWNYLYATAYGDDALEIIDISSPTSPSHVWSLRAAWGRLDGAQWIKVVGNYAYVTSERNNSFQVIDVSTPSSPSFVWQLTNGTSWALLDWPRALDIYWDYAFVTSNDSDALVVIDISTPSSPSHVISIVDDTTMNLDAARGITIDGEYAYVSANRDDGVSIFDISDPTDPQYVSSISDGWSRELNGASCVEKVWDIVYVCWRVDDWIEILEITHDDTSPYIEANNPVNYWSWTISNFSATYGARHQWTVTFQISKNNGTTWYYLNGTTRTTTTGWVSNSSTIAEINSELEDFNALSWTSQFLWKAFLTSDEREEVEIDTVTLSYVVPGPWGVWSWLQIWLRADKWTSTTTHGNSVSTWNDQSWNDYHATAWNAPTYLNNASNHVNYNPMIDFDGTNDYLQNNNNGAYTHSHYMVIIPDNQVDGTLTWEVPFGVDCNSWVLSTWSCWLTFAWFVLWASTAAINDEVIMTAIGSSTSRRSAQTWVYSYASSEPMLLWFNENSWATNTDIYEKGVKIDNYTANTYQSLSTADYNIGRSTYSSFPFYYDGKVAEIINYNTRLNDTDRKSIESYLWFKYGITLNSWNNNYTASDGTSSMWNTTTAWSYTHDIFGIGRDDGPELSQVKSKSSNSDAIITLEAVWEGTNMSPSFTDIANYEFLSISNNDGSNTWKQTDTPTGYYVLDRYYRAQETGEVGTVDLEFDVGDSDFDVPALSTGTGYYFIYDSDNDNTLSDETPQLMTNTSWNLWKISGIDLDDAREFTLATQASTNNIPTDISLSNNIINENIAIGSTVGTLSTTDADTGDSHTYSLVAGTWDDDNASFSITTNVLSIDESPDYEMKSSYSIRIETDDGNGGQFQKQFTITVNDIWEVIDSIIDFENPWKYSVTSWTWTRTTNNPSEWSYSLESSNSWNNTQSCFELSQTLSATGTVTFDYQVSSQAGSDYLRFYIDDIEQQAWSWNAWWSTYTKNDLSAQTHNYKWCYIKDGAGSSGSDKAWIDYITIDSSIADITPPVISAINYASGSLLPWGNHDIIITYSDADSGIDTTSDSIELYKWNGSTWWSDIASSGFDLTSKTITATQASYPTDDLSFWKYRYDFSIDDNASNSSSTGAVFYIDEPELIISTGSLDIWELEAWSAVFSALAFSITVKTVGASFDLILDKTSSLLEWTGVEIIDWDGSEWVWYDQSPYTSTITKVNPGEVLASQTGSINTDGDKNSYNYNIKFWAQIVEQQAAGNYSMDIEFTLDLDY